jgi:hypothetical protein
MWGINESEVETDTDFQSLKETKKTGVTTGQQNDFNEAI